MKFGVTLRNAALGICLAALSGMAGAGDLMSDYSLQPAGYSQPAVSEARDMQSFMLAQNEAANSNAAQNVASAVPAKKTEFKEPLYSLNKVHAHLGIATILAAAATAVTAPGEGGCEGTACTTTQQPPRQRNGTHAHLARATVALATATIATGILAHWDDIHLANGITDPDNLHALLGIAGAAIMAKAVNKSAGSTVPVSHAAQAEFGAALMVIGIKLVW